jgi:hypothetical protein
VASGRAGAYRANTGKIIKRPNIRMLRIAAKEDTAEKGSRFITAKVNLENY